MGRFGSEGEGLDASLPPAQERAQMLTLDLATTALAGVVDPVFSQPMLELGTLRLVDCEGGVLRAEVRLPTPSKQLEAQVTERIVTALARVGGAAPRLSFTHDVPTREVMGDDPVPGVKNVILVMSGKGGVGKSTTAVNLALALSQLGLRVGLLDADVYGPSIPTMMGVSGNPISKDGQRITPLERFGVKMMSIGFLLEDDKQAVVWRGPMLHGALQQFLRDVDWGALDFLVIDLPPGTGDVALTMAQKLKITGVVMVTTPQEVALADVYKAVSMCQKLAMPILGIVENMSWFIDSAGVRHTLFGQGGGDKIAQFAQAPLLAQIPIETTVQQGGDAGLPVVKGAPETAAAKAFAELAERVVNATARHHFDRQGGKLPSGKAPTRLKILR
jgi:ATP-binding protein involved in chromosome partitioning